MVQNLHIPNYIRSFTCQTAISTALSSVALALAAPNQHLLLATGVFKTIPAITAAPPYVTVDGTGLVPDKITAGKGMIHVIPAEVDFPAFEGKTRLDGRSSGGMPLYATHENVNVNKAIDDVTVGAFKAAGYTVTYGQAIPAGTTVISTKGAKIAVSIQPFSVTASGIGIAANIIMPGSGTGGSIFYGMLCTDTQFGDSLSSICATDRSVWSGDKAMTDTLRKYQENLLASLAKGRQ